MFNNFDIRLKIAKSIFVLTFQMKLQSFEFLDQDKLRVSGT